MSELSALPFAAMRSGAAVSSGRHGAVSESGSGSAWLREMERAQFQAWLRITQSPTKSDPPPLHGRDVSATIRHVAPVAVSTFHQTVYSRLADEQAPTRQLRAPSPAIPAPFDTSGESSSNQSHCTIQGEAPIVSLHRTYKAAIGSQPCSISTPPLLASGAAEHPSLSVHIESLADGLSASAWIGINPNAVKVTHQLTLLREAIARSLLSEKGLRLAALTVNGRLLWQANSQTSNN